VYKEGIPATDDGMKFVGEMTQLVSLGLSGTNISGTGLRHLKDLAGLNSLNIDCTKIRNSDLRHFAPFKSLIDIRAYDLDRLDINDIGAIHLAKLP
jgi:hypothetical protein